VTSTIFCAWGAMLLLILLSWLATRRIPRNLETASTMDLAPRGLQNIMELVIEIVHDLVQDIAGSRVTQFFPIVMTIFLFVLVSNWFDLLPGFGSIGLLTRPESGTTGFLANGAILTAQPAAGPTRDTSLLDSSARRRPI